MSSLSSWTLALATAVCLQLCVITRLAHGQIVDPNAPKPHIVMILADDFGWANIGVHRPDHTKEVQTPNLDALIAAGHLLDQAYSFKFCSPTRSSLQSGRLPTHVNNLNLDMNVWNPNDTVSGFAGIPRNMTGMASKLKQAGYMTHQVGKWDAGMATVDHTPHGRGYDTSFGYFHHDNDYWTEIKEGYVDLWNTTQPAHGRNGSTPASAPLGPESDYEEYKFAQRVYEILRTHDAKTSPLFLNYDLHIVHEPLQVPTEYFNKFDFMTDDYGNHRQLYTAMVNYMDTVIGNLTDILKQRGMWENTVLVFQSDNGGPSFSGSNHTANNWPLRGSKMTNWQGGTRVNAFVTGGFLNSQTKRPAGAVLEGITHVCDFYATFCSLAGVDPTDHRAAAANLPPIDSLNLWPYITGHQDQSPRTSVYMDTNAAIVGDYKILVGDHPNACWMGPKYPNATTDPGCNTTVHCGDKGCLFNIRQDPTEHNDLADDMPEMREQLLSQLVEFNKTFFNPQRSGGSTKLAAQQAEKNGDFWGPFIFP